MYASRNRTVYASRNMVLYDATSALRHLEPVHSWEKTPSLSLEQDHSQGDHLLIPGQLDEEVPEEEESHVGFSMMTQSHPKWTLTHFSSEKSRETMVLMSVIRRKLLVSSQNKCWFPPLWPWIKMYGGPFEWNSFIPNCLSMTMTADSMCKEHQGQRSVSTQLHLSLP